MTVCVALQIARACALLRERGCRAPYARLAEGARDGDFSLLCIEGFEHPVQLACCGERNDSTQMLARQLRTALELLAEIEENAYPQEPP